ncbi:MAG: iron ABC transporter ATP-binding protein [Acidimicrobiaceae bacterium]|jgi:iron complex transport system ATP-binding protein|nr:iron ABC transporter ATP-binding protein [Acidimicrobiaceae bacterium]|tara:strand:- start:77681 stop:78475 length:795 start_codon:yes stop_codon:yes gene_type:complete
MIPKTILKLSDVTLRRENKAILDSINFQVQSGENWVVLGPNGCGKTSLLRIASLFEHPSSGVVSVLGKTLGKTDIRKIRHLVGFTGHGISQLLRPDLETEVVVMTAKYGALEPWWHTYTNEDRAKANAHMKAVGVNHLAKQKFGTLSSGEKQRALLARSLMSDPELLLLDEPASGLDLPGREELINSLSALTSDSHAPPIVMVTHHVEEIPSGFSHILFMKNGSPIASGPISEILNTDNLSKCFGIHLEIREFNGRWSAQGKTN